MKIYDEVCKFCKDWRNTVKADDYEHFFMKWGEEEECIEWLVNFLEKELIMPKVGKKKFPYDERGEMAAKKEMKKTGKKMEMTGKKKRMK